MDFQVPQFIEVENKLFGPLTLAQFVYIAGGVAVAFLFYLLPGPIFIKGLPMAISIGFGVALAFYKVNNRSLIFVLQSMIKYYLSSKLYLWKKDTGPSKKSSISPVIVAKPQSELSESKIDQLAWSLDVKEKIQ